MYEQEQYHTRPLSPAVQRRRRVAMGVLALALIVVIGFVAGHVVGSSSKSGAATKPVKPADSSSNVQATPEASQAERRARQRRREKRRERAQAQSTVPATPPAAPSTTPAAPTPHANTPQGQKELKQSPDCQNAPPPPKGYKGPVQC